MKHTSLTQSQTLQSLGIEMETETETETDYYWATVPTKQEWLVGMYCYGMEEMEEEWGYLLSTEYEDIDEVKPEDSMVFPDGVKIYKAYTLTDTIDFLGVHLSHLSNNQRSWRAFTPTTKIYDPIGGMVEGTTPLDACVALLIRLKEQKII